MSRKSEIYEMIAETLLLEKDAVRDEAHLQDDLGADSLMLVELAEVMSGKYEVEFDPDEIIDMANVAELVQLVETRLQEQR